MNEAKHTPGPWQVREDSKELSWDPDKVMVDASGQEMLAFYRHDPSDRISLLDADWKIIAAAPEMLEALKECAEYIGTDAHPDFYREETVDLIYSKALQAIAKAEGREP
jgi:hypothetical protein